MVILLVAAACSNEQAAARCPGQFDPKGMSSKELRGPVLGQVPETGATTRATVENAFERSRSFIKSHYTGVTNVEIGRGLGVTVTRDEFGNTTFHHKPDWMVVATISKKSNCPDPELGTLFVLSDKDVRVPVRFLYRR